MVLGPSGLTLDPGTGRIEVAAAGSGVQGGQVTRDDVASVIAAVVERDHLSGRTIEFNNGPTPIEDALDALRD